MEDLTIHQRINIKSRFYPNNEDKAQFRIRKPGFYGQSENNQMGEIPFWAEDSYQYDKSKKFNVKK